MHYVWCLETPALIPEVGVGAEEARGIGSSLLLLSQGVISVGVDLPNRGASVLPQSYPPSRGGFGSRESYPS